MGGVNMSSAETILATERLTKKFGGLVAVDNVNFSLQKGEIRAVIGPNGAGKTTLFNLIAGTIQPTSGKIFFKRKDITALSVCERVKFGLGRSFQDVNICRGLTVRQNALHL
jgi:branched-chain amino acid transport system ATP-binding protein